MASYLPSETLREDQLGISHSVTDRQLEASSLPAPRTSFVGREREVELVQTLLRRDDVRLVTLTGPGGVGKTRIAIRAVDPIPAIRFVDLADVTQPALVLPAIAASLGIRPDGRAALDQLRSVLRQDKHLLVLDNFEQVLPAAAALGDLLDACSRVKLVVTSRAVLGIPGEHLVDIRPFPLPPMQAPVSETQAAGLDACHLFVDRVLALDAEFALTSANAGIIVAICQRLDGLPLAIELAASWVSVLSLGTLLDQLDRRLALPDVGSLVTPQRQRSLRETISWSHGLLDAPSQILFRRLAAFGGGCTLDAIWHVCGDDSLDVLLALRTLVTNSLVRRIGSSAGDSRYVMLETVHEFGVECLRQSGEAETVRGRHAAWFLALAERVEAHLNTIEREAWLDRLEAEHGNLYRSLAWAFEQEDAELAVALCGALLPFWQFRFHSGDGREWVGHALTLDQHASTVSIRKAVYCAGTLAYMHGDMGEAAAHFADALRRYRDAGDPEMTGRVELALGRMAWDADDQVAARAWFDAAKQRFERCGDQPGLALSLHYLGLVAFKEGRHDPATAFLRDALVVWRSLGFTWELARCIPGHLADVARAEGNVIRAMHLYRECLTVNWDCQDLENVSWSLAGLAVIIAAQAQVEQAAHLMALAERFKELTGAPLTPHIRYDHDLAMRIITDAVGAERFAVMQMAVRNASLAAEIAAALEVTGREPSTKASPRSGNVLTPREREVLQMMASGQSNQDIANALFLSVGTVKVHVTHILAKLGVKSRAAATDHAHRHGLA